MPTPREKEEFQQSLEWKRKARSGSLVPIPCIGAWIDICGFGSQLERAKWNLSELQLAGAVNLLSEVYQRVGHPFWVGVEPEPYENVLVLNDGIARTVDIGNVKYARAVQAIFYFRDLVLAHLDLLWLTNRNNLGVRTVLAGGERIQYSPAIFTGNSILLHGDSPSEWGKRLLEKNFLYNPVEFQMNTSFAKAYSIDSNGSKSGFNVNGFFIEKMFFERFGAIPGIDVSLGESAVYIKHNNNIALEMNASLKKKFAFKGLDTVVYGISSVRVDASFEGEETIIDLINYETA